MRNVIQFLEKLGFDTVDPSYYSYIENWGKWYRGKVASVHNYIQFNGIKKVYRSRKTLGMAKKVCEDWANLLLNDKVKITADNEAVNEAVDKVLEYNRFSVYGNQLIEKAFAFGTGALVEYMDGDDVIVDYIVAKSIYPLSWDNGDITECAFASERKQGKDRYIYLNIHRLDDNGLYVIENHYLLASKGGGLTEVALPDGVADYVETGSAVPRFQIIYPNIANNIDLDSPLGLSVYANALDQLEACDVLFDSFYNEFALGRKRIMVPLSMVRRMMEVKNTGEKIPVFDENDVEFYAIETGDASQQISEMNGELRIDAHVKGLSEAVNMVGYKCGFGEHKYRFDGSGVKTATEIVSEDSDMFRSVRKHEAVISSAITGLYKAVADMRGLTTDFAVKIDFDDSIIEDTAAEQARDRQDVLDGIMTKVEYRMKYYGENEETASAKIAQIGDVDSIFA